ncbi:MAG: ABC transporter substrate-binding protein, partial [Caldivirga sp.]
MSLGIRVLVLVSIMVAAVAMAVMTGIVHAQANTLDPTFETAYFGWFWNPAARMWNPYTPQNYVGWPIFTYMPLADYSDPTSQWWPVLAENWTVFPQNHTLIIYLRRGLYWFNGSATIPFTAWDVYAEFYIGVKAFRWFYPYLTPQNADKDIIVINNYTISIHFDHWSPTAWYWILVQTISTPWPVWKSIVEELKTMNASQAFKFGQVNITEFNPPYWGLSPYYLVSIGPTYATLKLVPPNLLSEWDKIFPFHTWQYYPEVVLWNNPGPSNVYAAILKGESVYIEWIAFSLPKYIQGINSTPGFGWFAIPDLSIFGISIPDYYPFNIPQVRQAFLYIINRSEAAAAWGPPWLTYPVWINVPAPAPNVAPGLYLTFPESIRSIVINYTVNWTYAAQLLESAGLHYKNGQWYLPNGTPLTLTLYASSNMVNWITQAQVAALRLSEFGIPTKIITLESGTYSTQVSSCQLPAVVDWFFAGSNKGGYNSLWVSYDVEFTMTHPAAYTVYCNAPGQVTPFAYPVVQDNHIVGWYCKPYTTDLPVPNSTIIWCVNSTFGYINLTNWYNAMRTAIPGSKEYEELIKILFSWYEYYVPGVEISVASITAAYPKSVVDADWIKACLPYTNPKYTEVAYNLMHQWAQLGIMAELNNIL